LQDEHLPPAHGLADLHRDLSVREARKGGLAQLEAEDAGHVRAELPVGAPGEQAKFHHVSSLPFTQSGLFTWRARPSASAYGGTSSVITDPAATTAWAPMETGATREVLVPMNAPASIIVRCLRRPSKLQVTVPAPMLAPGPISASPM